MREILFRGKRISDGDWSYGTLRIGNTGVTIIVPDDTPLGKYGKVDPETVCQFTGIIDKNGVKVFENDIVRDYDEENEVFVVKYYAHIGYPAFDVEPEINCECNGLSYLAELQLLEVIGNIFDNPELMKGGA